MNREVHVRVWERAEVKFLRATRQKPALPRRSIAVRFASMNGLCPDASMQRAVKRRANDCGCRRDDELSCAAEERGRRVARYTGLVEEENPP